ACHSRRTGRRAIVGLGLRDARLEVQPRLLSGLAAGAKRLRRLVLANLEGLTRRVEAVFDRTLRLLVSVDHVLRQIACGVARHVGRATGAALELPTRFLAALRREQQRDAGSHGEPHEKRRRPASATLDHYVWLVLIVVGPVPHVLISSSRHRRPFDFCRTASFSLTDP